MAQAGRQLFSRLSSRTLAIAPIQLHYSPTPNGWKVTMLLEEAALPYQLIPVDLAQGDQHLESFLRISPNGRMPAIVDPNCDDLSVFESGAIMVHIADSYECASHFLGDDYACRSPILEWLFWVNAGLGASCHASSNTKLLPCEAW